jgi:hypothetical protein
VGSSGFRAFCSVIGFFWRRGVDTGAEHKLSPSAFMRTGVFLPDPKDAPMRLRRFIGGWPKRRSRLNIPKIEKIPKTSIETACEACHDYYSQMCSFNAPADPGRRS